MTPTELIVRSTDQLFGRRDMGAVERHWSPNYIEHSIVGLSGLDGLRRVASGRPEGFGYEMIRLLNEDDMVVAHGIYSGLGPDPYVACDLWRVDGDKIVEHWDGHQPWVAKNPSGRSMTDGATVVTDKTRTVANKKVVQGFVELIMMGGDRSQLPNFFDGDRFVQHNPVIADGVSGLGQAIQSGVWAAVVLHCHRIIADGNFVFTQAEGTLHDEPTAFYDLFRVADGKLAEHWDVVFAQPETLAHSNGLF